MVHLSFTARDAATASAGQNIVCWAGMLQPNPSLRTAVLWQWANQSSNALINHANRNATGVRHSRFICKRSVCKGRMRESGLE